MNLWYDLTPGTADQMNVVIEIGKGSANKYELDKETGLITLDRVLHSAQTFPFDYGFIPQTLWADGDALDVVLLTTYPLLAGTLVRARPVGLINMIDGGESDDKIIAVPVSDPRWDMVKDLEDINPHTLKEFEHFFTTYKKLQNKEVKITGFAPKAKAIEAFTRGGDLYRTKLQK